MNIQTWQINQILEKSGPIPSTSPPYTLYLSSLTSLIFLLETSHVFLGIQVRANKCTVSISCIKAQTTLLVLTKTRGRFSNISLTFLEFKKKREAIICLYQNSVHVFNTFLLIGFFLGVALGIGLLAPFSVLVHGFWPNINMRCALGQNSDWSYP